jgi:hypothetical protein
MLEVAMQKSMIGRRHPTNYQKGNHRRTLAVGIRLTWDYTEYV